MNPIDERTQQIIAEVTDKLIESFAPEDLKDAVIHSLSFRCAVLEKKVKTNERGTETK